MAKVTIVLAGATAPLAEAVVPINVSAVVFKKAKVDRTIIVITKFKVVVHKPMVIRKIPASKFFITLYW